MSRLREHLRKFFDIYVAVALIVFAARFGVEVTQTLAWPYDIDHFRDMAVTETIARGSWWTDPYYQGEYLWYNPLVPAIAAVAEVATDLPAHVIYARFGAYLNVAAPLAFYWLLRNTLGPLPALASLVVFLFVPPRGAQGWNTPTYSPWLFPMIFAQALYYAALLSLSRLWQRQTTWYRVSAGALIGLTLLAHTAPAIMLVSIVLVRALVAVAMGTRSARREIASASTRDVVVVLGVAALISLPLTWSVVGHYGLRTLNDAPRRWVFELLLVQNLRGLLYTQATVATGLALVGIWAFTRRHLFRSSNVTVFVLWGAVNSLFLLRGYFAQLIPLVGRLLPPLVPEYHFLFYMRGLLAAAAGFGFAAVVGWIAPGLVRFFRRLGAGGRSRPASASATTGTDPSLVVGYTLIVIIAFQLGPRLNRRFDFNGAIREARQREATLNVAMYEWIRASTTPSAVFLASDELGQFVVGPAGRKLVAIGAPFSNPYVDLVRRNNARNEMYAAILANERETFCSLASRYDVSYVTLDGQQAHVVSPRASFLEPRWRGDGDSQVWAVVGCRL